MAESLQRFENGLLVYNEERKLDAPFLFSVRRTVFLPALSRCSLSTTMNRQPCRRNSQSFENSTTLSGHLNLVTNSSTTAFLHGWIDGPRKAFQYAMGDQLRCKIMLSAHVVHADLSAYNMLYAGERLRVIDMPQAVDARTNPSARVAAGPRCRQRLPLLRQPKRQRRARHLRR